MFKKPVASLKSFSPLRSSDKRRLRDEILASFPELKEMKSPISDAPVNAVITPDGLQSAKFTSYIEEPGTMYTDAEGTPLWFKISNSKKESLIVPSLYMIWKFPTLIPGLTTWNPVVDKLKNGADLMIPGVITANTEIPDIEEGCLVVIRARGNRYPLAIGTMAVSGKVIASSRGIVPPKGKAVHILHVHEDQLWVMGNKQNLPSDWASGPKPVLGDEYESTDGEDGDATDEEDVRELADSLGTSVVLDINGKERAELDYSPVTEACERTLSTIEAPAPVEEEPIVVLSTAEVDQALSEALLQVLKFKITEANSKELLPMNASTLYSSYVLPNRSRGRAAEADIKKSSWKKLAKWLKAVEKQDLVKCKEIKGELFLLGVNWNHPQLKGFAGHKTVEMDAVRQAKADARVQADQQASSSNSKVLEVMEAYRPNGSSASLFENTNRSKDGYYTLQELRALLAEYFKEKNLADPKNQRIIKLDETLREALLKKGENVDRIPRDQTSERLIGNMVLHHFVGYKGQPVKFVKGGVKSILITQEIRTGRKTVTKVSGLEHFMIDVEGFGQEIQVLCASSVAITPLVGASPKLNLREVMVQGPQLKNITAVLQEKGVPKKYVEFLDKTSKKK
ncbi:hypothetical protein BGZ93_011028 [Podila epicladia]|nr:hypothetical protein BGZ92_004779 [Podila epicladia]KAG0098591.1 hypothetical protein BGZ93_011028 [Podila epicladia]